VKYHLSTAANRKLRVVIDLTPEQVEALLDELGDELDLHAATPALEELRVLLMKAADAAQS